jgi:lipopolysaccharide transport system ATP-binding protein
MSTAITVQGLGKRYLLGEDASRHRIADVLFPWRSGEASEFWALRDISFRIEEGESVGIVGRNGAGKSTLLKILSRITAPTAGRAIVRGRVGTLLEAGTGFHPELTGRDNIFLSGAILGLRQAEIRARFDEIVEFAEVSKFIDTPVKRYSSGMQVRLAFAVAMYLDPEILIVDEVLSVGDLGFQRKSINRMREATDKEGRTVLFVSHSLEAVKKSCQRILVLEEGRLTFDGDVDDGSEFYRNSVPHIPESVKDKGLKNRLSRTSGAVRFTKANVVDSSGQTRWSFQPGEAAKFRFDYEVHESVPNLGFLFRLLTQKDEIEGRDEMIMVNIWEMISDAPVHSGERGTIELELPNLALRPTVLSLYVCLGRAGEQIFYDVIDTNIDLPPLTIRSKSKARSDHVGIVSLDYKLRRLGSAEAMSLAPSEPSGG